MLTEKNTTTYTGSKTIFETLKNLGVDTVFGYPGGIVLDLYDQFYKQSNIKHILTRHEQAAVHAAEGYARETGKCGVVLVTSGPGATNTVTGIVNAYMDGYPLIVLTGQVFKDMLGKNAFQEANICEITKSCTKGVFQIRSASEIQQTLKKAFALANSGKKGPVVIDIVKNVFTEEFDYEEFSNTKETKQLKDFDITKLVKMLSLAKRPVIITGGGVKHSSAENELLEFAQNLSIPVVSTMMGLGTFPSQHNLNLGYIGIFGDNAANEIVNNADLVISLGARLNDRITCKLDIKSLENSLFQIDINEKEISNFIQTSNYIVADIKEVLCNLNQNLKNSSFDFWNIEVQQAKLLNKQQIRSTNMLHSFEVMKKLEQVTKEQEITFTTEVGQHQLWAVKNIETYKNRKIFVSGGSGTMGFGLPAAIGASVANKNKKVICITGDGSFQMSLSELATCKDYGLNIKIFILNNGYLGMVRQLQEKQCNGRYSETKISNPDFVTLAKSYNIPAERISNLEDVDSAIKKALNTDGTYLIDFVVEPMEVL